LQAAGDAVGIDWTPTFGGSILEAEYRLPTEKVPYPRANVRVGSLPRQQRADAARALKTTVLPAFAQWLARVVALPDNSPILLRGPEFKATYRGGLVDVRHDFSRG